MLTQQTLASCALFLLNIALSTHIHYTLTHSCHTPHTHTCTHTPHSHTPHTHTYIPCTLPPTTHSPHSHTPHITHIPALTHTLIHAPRTHAHTSYSVCIHTPLSVHPHPGPWQVSLTVLSKHPPHIRLLWLQVVATKSQAIYLMMKFIPSLVYHCSVCCLKSCGSHYICLLGDSCQGNALLVHTLLITSQYVDWHLRTSI